MKPCLYGLDLFFTERNEGLRDVSEILILCSRLEQYQEVVRVLVISGRYITSGEPGKAANQWGLRPPAAQSEGVACTDQSETDENERVDDVIVHKDVVLGRQRGAPHQDDHDRPGDCGDPRPNPKKQCHGDPNETEHKQPVHQASARDGLVEAREGPAEPLRKPKVGFPPLIQA